MKQLDLPAIHEATLNVMDRLHAICEENGIRYNIYWGTLLGAVRHGGFIPWDDDFDICMLRDDYNRLCELLSPEKGRYRLATRKNTENYYHGIARFFDSNYEFRNLLDVKQYDMGVFIDIYPLDSCGETVEDSMKIFRKIDRLNADYCIYCTKYSLSNRWKNLVRVPYCNYLHLKHGPDYSQRIDREIEDTIYRVYDRDSRKVGFYWCALDEFRALERAWFLDQELIPFEDRAYWAPKKPKELLAFQYGDYMRLPPESERVATHSYNIYEKDL